MPEQWVYNFGGGLTEGRADMRELLGGKGANLAEMSSIGLPVPPGFTITTDLCTHYYTNNKEYPAELKEQVEVLTDIVSKIAVGKVHKKYSTGCIGCR